MDVFQALKLLQVNHQPASQRELVVTDPTGKPDATMSALLADVLGKLAIFGDLDNAHSPEELINQLHAVTPPRYQSWCNPYQQRRQTRPCWSGVQRNLSPGRLRL